MTRVTSRLHSPPVPPGAPAAHEVEAPAPTRATAAPATLSWDTDGGDAGTATAPPFVPPEVDPHPVAIGPYRVLGLLGKGGMGVVYRAQDRALRREVALKVMLPRVAANPLAKARFVREARAQARVEHDHVAAIHQVGEHAGVPFLVMPLLKGMTLHAALKANPRPPLAEVVRIGREVAEGLAAAHGQELVHRDIKPANIWLEGRRLRVKVLDFGLARSGGAGSAPTVGAVGDSDTVCGDGPVTRTGAVLGTPAYMSPEQGRGGTVDPRTDLWSLGVVLYQMLTGRLPFAGATPLLTLESVAADHPPPPADPAVPPALTDLVMRLLSKDPAGRPPGAEAVAGVLRAVEVGLAGTAQVPAHDSLDSVPTGFPAPDADPFAELDSAEVSAGGSEEAARRGGYLGFWLAGAVLAAVAALVWVAVRSNAGNTAVAAPADPDETTIPTRPNPQPPVPGVQPIPGRGPVDEVWVRWVATLRPVARVKAVEDKFRERNPGFGEINDYQIDNGAVVAVKVPSDVVTDLSPLRGLPGLRQLTLAHASRSNSPLRDLGPLRGLKLEEFYCWSSQVSDLSPLAGMPLTRIGLAGSPVRDIGPLRGAPLVLANLDHCPIEDLTPLEGSPIKTLHLFGNPVLRNLGPLEKTSLEWLTCRATPVRDFSPLRNLPLQSLHADCYYGCNLGLLRNHPTLSKLNGSAPAEMWKNLDAREVEFEVWLKGAAGLEPQKQVRAVADKLKAHNPGFDGNLNARIEDGAVREVRLKADAVLDLSPLRAFTHLRAFAASGCAPGRSRLHDLAPLGGLPLRQITLERVPVTDAGVAHLAGSASIEEVILKGTRVTGDAVRRLQEARPGMRVVWDGVPADPAAKP